MRFELPDDLAAAEEGDLLALLRADDAGLSPPGGPPDVQRTDSEWSTSRLVAPEVEDDVDQPTVASVEAPSVASEADTIEGGFDEVPGPPPAPRSPLPGIHQQETQRMSLSDLPVPVPAGRPTELIPTPPPSPARRRADPDRTVHEMAVTSSLAGLAMVVLVFLTGAAYLLLQHREALPF